MIRYNFVPWKIAAQPLSAADISTLEEAGITPPLAMVAGLHRVSTSQALSLLQFGLSRSNFAGLLIPNVWPGEKVIRSYRVLRDRADLEQ